MTTQQAGQNPSLITNANEIKIIQSVFTGNEQILKNIRAVFLNLDPTPQEIATVQSLPDEAKDVLRDRMLPHLNKNTPIGQVKDEWLGAEQMVFGANEMTITQSVQYKRQALNMTRQALALLDNGAEWKPVDLSYHPDIDKLGINLLARNQFIRHVESQLHSLWVIANQVVDTPKQLAAKVAKDSTQ